MEPRGLRPIDLPELLHVRDRLLHLTQRRPNNPLDCSVLHISEAEALDTLPKVVVRIIFKELQGYTCIGVRQAQDHAVQEQHLQPMQKALKAVHGRRSVWVSLIATRNPVVVLDREVCKQRAQQQARGVLAAEFRQKAGGKLFFRAGEAEAASVAMLDQMPFQRRHSLA